MHVLRCCVLYINADTHEFAIIRIQFKSLVVINNYQVMSLLRRISGAFYRDNKNEYFFKT